MSSPQIGPHMFANYFPFLHPKRTSSIFQTGCEAPCRWSDLYTSLEHLTAISLQFIPAHTAPPVVNTTHCSLHMLTHTHTKINSLPQSATHTQSRGTGAWLHQCVCHFLVRHFTMWVRQCCIKCLYVRI